MGRTTARGALLACSLAGLFFLPAGVANAGGSTHDRTHLDVHFPDHSPGRSHGGSASISVCDFNSLDEMRNHFDGDKSSKAHDAIDKAFTDAVKIDGREGNEAFDYRHKGCDSHKSHHDSSSSHHTQTKVIPKGAPATGGGPLGDGSMGPS